MASVAVVLILAAYLVQGESGNANSTCDCGYDLSIQSFMEKTVPMEITKLFCHKNGLCFAASQVDDHKNLCTLLKMLALSASPEQSASVINLMYNDYLNWTCKDIDKRWVNSVIRLHPKNKDAVTSLAFSAACEAMGCNSTIKQLCLATLLMLGYEEEPLPESAPTLRLADDTTPCPTAPFICNSNYSTFNFTVPCETTNQPAIQNATCTCSTSHQDTTTTTDSTNTTNTTTGPSTGPSTRPTSSDDSSDGLLGGMGVYYVSAVLCFVLLAGLGYIIYYNREKIKNVLYGRKKSRKKGKKGYIKLKSVKDALP